LLTELGWGGCRDAAKLAEGCHTVARYNRRAQDEAERKRSGRGRRLGASGAVDVDVDVDGRGTWTAFGPDVNRAVGAHEVSRPSVGRT
jgi:hypothetical protein